MGFRGSSSNSSSVMSVVVLHSGNFSAIVSNLISEALSAEFSVCKYCRD